LRFQEQTQKNYKKSNFFFSSFVNAKNHQRRRRLMNESTPIISSPTKSTTTTGNEYNFLFNSQNADDKNTMGGGVQLTQSNKNEGAQASNGKNNQRHSVQQRRPQILQSPVNETPKHFLYLTLTVRKDENGYGMKVSGDNPVYVESVKPGGAAQKAGLVAGDMILKV